MYIAVFPVSGGGFVTQLAIIQHLCESQLIPDLILASSGGNVAAYVAAAADWKWAAVERIAQQLSPEFFIKSWNSVRAISMILGYFKGDVYNRGCGVDRFLQEYFTPESITKYEIWTGTYNKNRQQSRMFCNRHADASILNLDTIDYKLTQSMPPGFAGGNMKLIGQVCIASASIPAIVPSQEIDNEHYIDGGVSSASPLSVLQEPILRCATQHGSGLHIIYVNSVDLARPDTEPIHNVFDTIRQATNDMVRSQTVIDRLTGYGMIRSHTSSIHREEFKCNYENMQRVKEIHRLVKYSMLEIYPNSKYQVDIVSFTGAQVLEVIHRAYDDCHCRLWWSDENSAVGEISVVLSSLTAVSERSM
jgi:predicted acylesterase/phospholipase RssA